MQMEHIVLDTNCLLMSIPGKSPYHRILTDLVEGRYILCITNEIIAEYEEILTQKMGRTIASNIINALLSSSHIRYCNPYYHFRLIEADADDNKFVDCAIQANARYIVTQDRHYDILKEISFPKVEVIDIDRFLSLLQHLPMQDA